ncbi:MAG: hypothetical protein NKF70_13670 [Methanobacterium sp. ERen5]|nr:MAG: hypothetical protein NKF70_13670 [Methanobacterium sp. ERen5]
MNNIIVLMGYDVSNGIIIITGYALLLLTSGILVRFVLSKISQHWPLSLLQKP